MREGSYEYKQLTKFEDEVFLLAAKMHFRQAHLINCLLHMIEELATYALKKYPHNEAEVLKPLESHFQEMMQRVRAEAGN